MNKNPALLLSVVSRQHGNNNGTITGQGSAVATILTKARMLYACEVILEYDAYDVLNVFYLPTLKDFVGRYKLWNEVMFWFTQMKCYNGYIPLLIRLDMSRSAG